MSSPAALAQGHALIGVNRPREAVKVLQRALASDPDDANVARLLGFAYMSDNQPRRALEILARAIAMEPEHATGHDYRAWALHEMHRDPEALQSAREAVRLEPADPNGLRTLCLMQLKSKLVDEAEATAQVLRSTDPSSPRSYDCLGLVRVAQRRPKEAVDLFREGLALDPQDPAIINNLGVAMLNLKKLGKSVEVFGDAVRANPRSDVSRRNLFVVTQLYLGWLGLLILFIGNVAMQAIAFHRFSPAGIAFGFFVTTLLILALRFYRLIRMDKQTRAFHLAEVKRARRSVLPVVIAVLGLSWVMLAAGYFVGWLDKLAATSGAAATTAVALLFGVVIPWPVEYLPWNRR